MRIKRKLGQNFLIDREVLEREAGYANPRGKIVIEIGAGDGRLTEFLLASNPKKLIAVEKEPELAEILKRKFGRKKNFSLVLGDFLKFEGAGDVIIGNIPYYISSPILFKLKRMDFERAVLCLQKEFAERILAKPGERNYGRLSVMSSIYFKAEFLESVPASAFFPKPKVDSALLLLRKTGRGCDGFAERFINAIFQHRKQTLRNALLHSHKFFGLSKEEMRKISERIKNRERRVFGLGKKEILTAAEELKGML